MSGGAALATAFVEVKPDLKGFGPALKDDVGKAVRGNEPEMDKQGKKLGGRLAGGMRGALGGLGGTLAAGIGGGLIAGGISEIAGSLGGFISGARDAEKIGRLTNAVIKSTGGVAGVTAEHVNDLATSISNKTGIDDDAIAASQNLLLTFTDLRNEVGKGNDVFDQATGLVTDMSVALGQSGKAGAIQLGKALNDPIKGVSALSRVGVSFTEQQKKQIKTLTESGDKLGAQKVILAELSKEFGGAAAAGADPMQKLGTVLTNVGEGLAGKLLPWLDKAATWLIDTGLPAFESFVGWLDVNVVPVLGNIASFIGTTVIPGVQSLAATFMKDIWPAVKQFAATLAENLQPAIAAVSDLWTNTLHPALIAAWPTIQKVIGVVVLLVGGMLMFSSKVIGIVVPAIAKLIEWVVKITTKAREVVTTVREKFGAMITFITGLPGKIATAASGMWDGIKTAFTGAINWIINAWNNLSLSMPKVDGDWNGPLPGGDFSVGGFSLDTPNIPNLGGGGIVPATRGGRIVRVAEAGQDEIVGPLAQVRRFLGADRSSGLVIENLNVQAAPGEMAADSVPRALQRTAFLLAMGG